MRDTSFTSAPSRYQHPSDGFPCWHAQSWANHQIWKEEAILFQINSSEVLVVICLPLQHSAGSRSICKCHPANLLLAGRTQKCPWSLLFSSCGTITVAFVFWHGLGVCCEKPGNVQHPGTRWAAVHRTAHVADCLSAFWGTDWMTPVVPLSPVSLACLCGQSFALEWKMCKRD